MNKMRIEDKVITIKKEDIFEIKEIIMDEDKDGAYEFVKKIQKYLEKNEENYDEHRSRGVIWKEYI